MGYLQVSIQLNEADPDILVAMLGEEGFDSFEEREGELLAYVQADIFDRASTEAICTQFGANIKAWEPLPDINWNAEWEKYYDPVRIWPICLIRAGFHPSEEGYQHELIIEPKMSFGTGHHATTELMIRQIADLKVEGKRVMDMGSGTGVLALFCLKLGALQAIAVDNDPWCYENAIENRSRNGFDNLEVKQGDASILNDLGMFDIFIANINRNILAQDLAAYSKHVNQSGELLLSGFYTEDIAFLEPIAVNLRFRLIHTSILNNWVCLRFTKD